MTGKVPTAARLDVASLAELVRIDLTQAERETLREQLERLLAYLDRLQTLDQTAMQPGQPAAGRPDAARPDEARAGLDCAAAVANGPRHDDEQFLVPRIMRRLAGTTS